MIVKDNSNSNDGFLFWNKFDIDVSVVKTCLDQQGADFNIVTGPKGQILLENMKHKNIFFDLISYKHNFCTHI